MKAEDFELDNLLNQLQNANNLINIQSISILKNIEGRKKRIKRKRINPMVDYGRREFKRKFRFSKTEVKHIYDLLDGKNTLEPIV